MHVNAGSDDPAFADLSCDDSAWLRLDGVAEARAPAVPARRDVIWLRFSFETPQGWTSDRPAIALGVVARADETFLNGVLIGGTGTIHEGGTAWHNYAPALPRLYPSYPSLLNDDGSNMLAVRIARAPYIDDGQPIGGPLTLVDHGAEAPAHTQRVLLFAGADYLFLGVELMVFLTVIFALLLGVRDRSIAAFALMFGPYFVGNLESRHLAQSLNITSPLAEYVAAVIMAWVPMMLVEFSAKVLDRPVGTFGRVLQAKILLSVLSYPLGYLPGPGWWRLEFNLVFQGAICVSLILIFTWAIRAAIRRKPYSTPLLVGLGVLMAAVIADVTGMASVTVADFGFRASELGTLILQLCLAFIIGQQILASEKSLERANAQALAAHEHERNRLARDIHDGIGQWLSSIKLDLQMLHAEASRSGQVGAGRLADLVAEVDTTIEDTRRIAHDLSPALLEEHG